MKDATIFDKGIDIILNTIESNVEFFFGNWNEGEGIGSSDIAACMHKVCRDLDVNIFDISEQERHLLQNGIRNKMSEILG